LKCIAENKGIELMKIRAVFFDMGGTIETFGYTRELRLKATPALQQMLVNAGIDLGLSDEALCEVISAGLQRYHDFSLASLVEYPPARVWREFILADYLFDPARLDAIAENLMFYIETHYYQRQMRPEVPEVLREIQCLGLKIGLISNVNSRSQVPTNLSKYHIQQYFDPIVLSSEYGHRKPDPSIFHYAARLMNVPTSACVYIGDRVARDIIGAQKAGFRLAVQIEHDFEHGEDDIGAIPDALIHNMAELVGILKAELIRPEPEPERSIRAILFDAGDILYYRNERKDLFLRFLAELGLGAGEDHKSETDALTQLAFCGSISRDEFLNAYLRIFGVTAPDQLKRGKQILEQENNKVVFFEGVKETLAALKEQGYLLGIITDTANSVHTKLSWFERGGFGHLWDSIISSWELGIRKPDPRIYQAALDQCGLAAGQAIFVGHKRSELVGARAVGMKTIAFNYDQGVEADYFIERFADLTNVLTAANKR
jgi:HAD superfamily hydrolase (TIGR01509 family)